MMWKITYDWKKFSRKKKVVLVILDGFGEQSAHDSNAITLAKTPNIDFIFRHFPHIKIQASGTAVGLPDGIMGNSEVGHLNLGAGRSVRLDLVRINELIENNTYKDQEHIVNFFSQDQEINAFHLMLLLSDGSVHSHINHLYATIHAALLYTKKPIYIHAFLDGRDTPPKSAFKYVKELVEFLTTLNLTNSTQSVQLASLMGRSIAMDRDQRFEKTKMCYDCLTGLNPELYDTPVTPLEFLQQQYHQNITDEFIQPALFIPEGKITNESAVFFLNFRPDRTRQLTLSLCQPENLFTPFPAPVKAKSFLCMTPYFDVTEISWTNSSIAFDKEKITLGLSEEISNAGLLQCKIAETEKYAHVTYFFNGGLETPFENEERILVPSPRHVPTYDHLPEMSAFAITQHLLEKMQDPDLSFIVVNFANADMVGHTGKLPATQKAIEAIDLCLGKIYDQCKSKDNMAVIITSDHGNADQMVANDGKTPHTAHTTALVPFVLISNSERKLKLKEDKIYALKDVAPTIMELLGMEIPKHFTGVSLLKE